MNVATKPEVCPNCGFSPVGTILYGSHEYSKELEQILREGMTILGGCCFHPGQIEWACKNSGCEFKRQKK